MAEKYIHRRAELKTIGQDFLNKTLLDDRLGDIKIPMLFIWGAKDALIDVSALPVWLKGIPQAQAHVFPELGHMPMVEDPKATAQVVQAFLKR